MNEIFSFLGSYTTLEGSWEPTFLELLLVPSSWLEWPKTAQAEVPKMLAPNYIPMLHISPENQRLLDLSPSNGDLTQQGLSESLSHWTQKQYIHSWQCKSTAGRNLSRSNHHNHNHNHVTSYALTDLLRPPIIVSYKGPSSHLHPFGLYYNFTLSILLFILVTCGRQFDLYFLRFLSTSFTFNSTKISSFLLWSYLV
jgi:hypothetical protein